MVNRLNLVGNCGRAGRARLLPSRFVRWLPCFRLGRSLALPGTPQNASRCGCRPTGRRSGRTPQGHQGRMGRSRQAPARPLSPRRPPSAGRPARAKSLNSCLAVFPPRRDNVAFHLRRGEDAEDRCDLERFDYSAPQGRGRIGWGASPSLRRCLPLRSPEGATSPWSADSTSPLAGLPLAPDGAFWG